MQSDKCNLYKDLWQIFKISMKFPLLITYIFVNDNCSCLRIKIVAPCPIANERSSDLCNQQKAHTSVNNIYCVKLEA